MEKWTIQRQVADATVKEAQRDLERARLKYQSQIKGVNTTVAAMQAELEQARYYLDNTTLVAPEDGRIVNLQVRPGMVAGEYRVGAIASFICDEGRYLLAKYNQESLKYVRDGQPVEVALTLYPGPDLRRQGRGRLEGQRRGPAAPERKAAGFRARAAAKEPPGRASLR